MKPRVYIETFGCQMNVADSERAATGLRASGYDVCNSIDDADVVAGEENLVRQFADLDSRTGAEPPLLFTFAEDVRWNAERDAVEFGAEAVFRALQRF